MEWCCEHGLDYDNYYSNYEIVSKLDELNVTMSEYKSFLQLSENNLEMQLELMKGFLKRKG